MTTQTFSWKAILHRLFIGALVLIALGPLAGQPRAARANGSFVVNSSADAIVYDSVLTLREAIRVSNGWAGPFTASEQAQLGGCTFDGLGYIINSCGAGYYDNITFDSSVTQIVLADNLPTLTDAGTWIDGSAGVPRIDGDSSGNYNVFTISGDNVTISNLSIVNGVTGHVDIEVAGGQGARIAYNYLGTLPGATNCSPSGVTRNSEFGVLVSSTASGGSGANGVAYIYGNTIGCHAGDGVAIAGSDYVYIGVEPDGVTASANWIGVNTANTPLPNGRNGVYLYAGVSNPASYNVVASNVIAGNGWSGVEVSASDNNAILGNQIGVDVTMSAALPNAYDGVEIHGSGATYNRVGYPSTGGHNIIAGNGHSGVSIFGGATDNTVDANLIGVNPAGTALPNGLAGVAIENSANNNDVGALGSIQTIAYNTREGIYIANSTGTYIGLANGIFGNGLGGIVLVGDSATGNAFTPYRIDSNGVVPIDLGNDGFTPNGSRTPPGPNNWVNYPVITSASGSVVNGTVCPNCQVNIYRATGNPAAAQGGGTYLGNLDDSDGDGYWSIDLSTLPGGAGLTSADIALVTWSSASGSSEMSPRPVVYLPIVLRN